jgi:hypothetical protein
MHNYSDIWLQDANGTVVGSKHAYMVNKMYALPGSSTAYLWYDNSDTLVRATMAQDRSGLLVDSLEATSFSITDVVAVANGAVAICENNTMAYYPLGTNTPYQIMTLESKGIVKMCAGSSKVYLQLLAKLQSYIIVNLISMKPITI